MESNELFALADELRELKETKKRLEDELKAVGLEIDRVDAESLTLARVDVESVSVVAKPWPSGAEPTPLGTDAVPVVDGPDFT